MRVSHGNIKIYEDKLVLNFGLPPKLPNLEGAKIREWKGRGGNILGSLPSNFLNHARGGTHFPSPPLPFPQTKQALRGDRISLLIAHAPREEKLMVQPCRTLGRTHWKAKHVTYPLLEKIYMRETCVLQWTCNL